MTSSEGEVVLKKSTTTSFVDKVSEFMMTDVRSWINQHLVEDIIMKPFLFQINSVVVSKEEEVNAPAWQFSGKRILMIADHIDNCSTSERSVTLSTAAIHSLLLHELAWNQFHDPQI
eukprot:7422160-Ditylum_brightwellii.AAC.1